MSASVGSRFAREQRRRRHDLAGLAVAALRHVELLPRALHRVRAVGERPSIVVTSAPATAEIGTAGTSATATPSTWTVHAPHCAMPQPNFVPLRSSASRRTQSSGMSGATSTVVDLPLTLSVTGM